MESKAHCDERGFLQRVFDSEFIADLGMQFDVQQTNVSLMRKAGTVKGMHLQVSPSREHKLVSCVKGAIFDVALDLRKDSATFGAWEAWNLGESARASLFIPPGVAHGMQSLEDETLVYYLHSDRFRAELDAGVNPLDPRIAIAWPQPIELLSARDQNLPMLDDWTPTHDL